MVNLVMMKMAIPVIAFVWMELVMLVMMMIFIMMIVMMMKNLSNPVIEFVWTELVMRCNQPNITPSLHCIVTATTILMMNVKDDDGDDLDDDYDGKGAIRNRSLC